VPDLTEFYINKDTGEDDPTYGTSIDTPWRTLQYALEQLNTYGEGLGMESIYIRIAPQTDPELNTQIIDNFRTSHTTIFGNGCQLNYTPTSEATNRGSLLMDTVLRNCVLCDDFNFQGGRIVLIDCDIRVTQSFDDLLLTLYGGNELIGPNKFNISSGQAIHAHNSIITDGDNTEYNFLPNDAPRPTYKPIDNNNTTYTKAGNQSGNWDEPNGEYWGVTDPGMALGKYRMGVYEQGTAGQVLGYIQNGTTAVAKDVFEALKNETYNLNNNRIEFVGPDTNRGSLAVTIYLTRLGDRIVTANFGDDWHFWGGTGDWFTSHITFTSTSAIIPSGWRPSRKCMALIHGGDAGLTSVGAHCTINTNGTISIHTMDKFSNQDAIWIPNMSWLTSIIE
jgi:hypothetical protein